MVFLQALQQSWKSHFNLVFGKGMLQKIWLAWKPPRFQDLWENPIPNKLVHHYRIRSGEISESHSFSYLIAISLQQQNPLMVYCKTDISILLHLQFFRYSIGSIFIPEGEGNKIKIDMFIDVQSHPRRLPENMMLLQPKMPKTV